MNGNRISYCVPVTEGGLFTKLLKRKGPPDLVVVEREDLDEPTMTIIEASIPNRVGLVGDQDASEDLLDLVGNFAWSSGGRINEILIDNRIRPLWTCVVSQGSERDDTASVVVPGASRKAALENLPKAIVETLGWDPDDCDVVAMFYGGHKDVRIELPWVLGDPVPEDQ